MKRFFCYFFLVLIFFTWQPTAFAQCHSVPDQAVMLQNFAAYLTNLTADDKNAIIMLPFYNNAAGLIDPNFSLGLTMYLYDRFSGANKNLAHPYLGYWAAQKLGLADEALYLPENAAKVASSTSARYVLFGTYQRNSYADSIRIHINIYDSKTKQPLSPAVQVTASFDDALFELISSGVAKAFEQGKVPFAAKTNVPSPTLRGFHSYAKGVNLALDYNHDPLSQAQLWFEKALKESYQKYDDAALGLARVYFMTALIKKLYHQDYTRDVLKARETLKYLDLKNGTAGPKYQLVLRYEQAMNEALKAASAVAAGNANNAKNAAKTGLKLLPEDGMLQRLYAMAGGTAVAGKSGSEIVLNDVVCVE